MLDVSAAGVRVVTVEEGPGWETFYRAMCVFVPEDARIVYSQFRGDPYADVRGKWRVRVLNDAGGADPLANVYVCVSAMAKNARGEFRRRKENFAGGLLLMIDDLGTGPGSKFPVSIVDPLPPSAMVETSPDNFQAIYLFDSIEKDMRLFEALIRGFIAEQFLSKDTGMAGVNRVFRPPVGVNGKAKYDGWGVKCRELRVERRYSIQRIAEAFNIRLSTAGPPVPRGATVNKSESIRAFVGVRSALRSAGMLKREEPNMAGWCDVVCPWTDEHTGGVDNGASIRLPSPENAFVGAFRCHHGACDGRRWRELTEWLAEEQGAVLGMINDTAAESLFDYREVEK